MSAILAALAAHLIPTIGTAIGALLTWAVARVAAASTSSNRATAAAAKVGSIGLTIAGDVWSALAPEIQTRLADGDLSKADREAIRALVAAQLGKLDVGDTLGAIAQGLGLPLAGVIGTIGEWVIDHFAKAHDAGVSTVSANAYPAPRAATAAKVLPPGAAGAAPLSAGGGR